MLCRKARDGGSTNAGEELAARQLLDALESGSMTLHHMPRECPTGGSDQKFAAVKVSLWALPSGHSNETWNESPF
jgi:hypothetical protein